MHKKAKGTMEDFPILHIIVDKKITPMKTYCFHWHFYLYMLYDYYPFKRLPTTTPTIPTPKPIKAIINKNTLLAIALAISTASALKYVL